MRHILLTIGALLPGVALAQPPQPGVDPCLTIGGCATNGQLIIAVVIQNTASFFIGVAAAAAVLFVVVGGFQMLLSFGNESAVTKGRNSVVFALGGFALVLAAQAIVSFIVRSSVGLTTNAAAVNPALAFATVAVNILMGVFNAVFAIVAVGAGLRMVLGHGKSEEFNKARSTLIFSIIGAVIINTARALVNIILTIGF